MRKKLYTGASVQPAKIKASTGLNHQENMQSAKATLLLWRMLLPGSAATLSSHVEDVGQVMMRPEEEQLLFTYLGQARTFFEFGVGASTLQIASRTPHLERQVGVDLDKRWIDRVRKHTWLRNGSLPATQRIKLLYVHIGKTSSFGYPVENASRCKRLERFCRVVAGPEAGSECNKSTQCMNGLVGRRNWWPAFSEAVLDATKRYRHGWDAVLVDSRFRTACALKSFFATRQEHISRSVVMVHDYARRKHLYGEIERFAKLEVMTGSLAVFRKKHDVDPIILQRTIRAYEYDPS